MATQPCACTTLRKAARSVTRFYDEAIEGAGLTTTQYAVLRQIERAGSVTMARVAEALLMDRTSLYRAIAPLERDGLVRGEASSDDARAKCLRLTPQGRARIARAAERWQAAQARVVAHVGAERWQQLATEILELAEHVATWTQEDPS